MTEIPGLSLPINNSDRLVQTSNEDKNDKSSEIRRGHFFFFFSSFFSLFPPRSSVVRTARLEGPFGCSTKYFNVVLCPGEDVARRRSAVAGGQVVDLVDGKFPVPDVEVGQLAYVGLRRIESSAQRVLRKKQRGQKSQSSATQSTRKKEFLSLTLRRRKNNKVVE